MLCLSAFELYSRWVPLLGAPFANFVQKRASYSTFTYIPKSVFPCRLKLVSEETGIAACKIKIWLNKFLTWRFIWLPKLMKLNLATVNRDSKASSARPEIDLLQVDLLASGASLFWPRSGRPRATKSLIETKNRTVKCLKRHYYSFKIFRRF